MMGNSYTSLSGQEEDEMRLQKQRTQSVYASSSLEKNCVVRKPVHSDAVTALAAIRPGMVVSGGRDSILALNNIDTGDCTMKWYGHQKEITKVIYRKSVAKHLLLTGSRDTTIKLWHFNSPAAASTLLGHDLTVTGLELINDSTLCSGSRDTTLKLWDVESGKCTRTERYSRNLVTHMCCSKETNLLAQTSEDKELKLWDSRDLSLVHQFAKKRHIQMHCDLSPDGNYCVTCSNGFNADGCEITLYDIRQRKLIKEMRGHDESVNCAIFLPQQVTWKKLVLSVSADHSTRIWNVEDGKCLWSEYVPSGGDLLSCVGFNDGSVIVCGLNACLCHMRLLGRAGRPYLHAVSMEVQPCHSQSVYQF